MKKTNKPLNILQINTVDINGGAARVAWNLYQAYREQGCNSWLAVGCKRSLEPNVFQVQNNGCGIRSIYLKSTLRKQLHTLEKRASGIKRLKRMLAHMVEPRRYIESILGIESFGYPGTWHLLKQLSVKPDIVHCHNLHGGYFDLRVLPWLSNKLPTVLTLHDAWLLSGHCSQYFGCQRWRLGCGDCPDLNIYPVVKRDATAFNWQRKKKIYTKSKLYITTPCHWLMQKVKQSILSPAIIDKKVINHGVDLTLFFPADKAKSRYELGFSQEANILLFASHGGSRNTLRDYTLITHLAKKLASKSTIIVCLGEEREPQHFGNVRVCFVPYQKDPRMVARYYQAADVCLHPALVDTFPNVILEALACGTPVVSTTVAGIPEQVDDGKTGFLVSKGDAEQMFIRVTQLLEDKNLMRTFSQNAVKVARQRFDLNYQVKTYLDWYQEILENFPCAARP